MLKIEKAIDGMLTYHFPDGPKKTKVTNLLFEVPQPYARWVLESFKAHDWTVEVRHRTDTNELADFVVTQVKE